MKYSILPFFILTTSLSSAQSQPEINVIYGNQHIFTVSTPKGWVNDKVAASKIGLVSFFYSKTDSNKNPKSHLYAMGYDKKDESENLKSFMNFDIANFKKKYPELIYEQIEIGKSGGIIDASMLSYSNLNDRYKEEVVYLETEFAFIIFIFSAFDEEDYQKYQSIFDQFTASFNYRGSNPKPFLEWQKKQK